MVQYTYLDIKEFELINNGEEVIIIYNDGKVVKKGVYHISNNSILCDDFETYIKISIYKRY